MGPLEHELVAPCRPLPPMCSLKSPRGRSARQELFGWHEPRPQAPTTTTRCDRSSLDSIGLSLVERQEQVSRSSDGTQEPPCVHTQAPHTPVAPLVVEFDIVE
jgi:hypothetical protein